MSIEQMCEILSISTKTGYRILREGKICCLKVGRAYRIPKAHLFTFLCIGCGEAVTAHISSRCGKKSGRGYTQYPRPSLRGATGEGAAPMGDSQTVQTMWFF